MQLTVAITIKYAHFFLSSFSLTFARERTLTLFYYNILVVFCKDFIKNFMQLYPKKLSKNGVFAQKLGKVLRFSYLNISKKDLPYFANEKYVFFIFFLTNIPNFYSLATILTIERFNKKQFHTSFS